ncbi:MAG: shikimate kinase [Firmicutes bacterium]|nr:shikimate kinase [Bacillota bacterium]
MSRTSIINEKTNTVLIGFMGCGKTTAGRIAARLAGMAFLDVDAEIERAEGKPIPDIFSECGESYFRAAESKVIAGLAAAGTANAIIATGGGAVKNPENARILREIGKIVYLYASPQKLFSNLGGAAPRGRPLLDVPDPAGEIGRLLAERDPIYRSVCDAVVDCDRLDLEGAAFEIAGIASPAGTGSL